MTDSKSEMDWADEIARTLTDDWTYISSTDSNKIAAAIRAAELRGRIAGLREAAEICGLDARSMVDAGMANGVKYTGFNIAACADKLEKETSTEGNG
jgi:hypothetical protein